MKQKIKITENTLKKLINESLKKILKEGMTADDPNNERWDRAREILGDEQMLNSIWNYLNLNQLKEILQWLDSDYDLGLFEDEEEFDADDEMEDDSYEEEAGFDY